MKPQLSTDITRFRAITNLRNYCDFVRIRSIYIHTAAKRIIFFMLVGQLVALSVPAQTSHSRRKEDFDVNEFDEKIIDIAANRYFLQLNNIQGITVVDARADTSVIGFMQKRIAEPFFDGNASMKNQTEQRINRTPTFIALGTGLQQEANRFMQKGIVFAGNESMPGILMVIKKLWLSDELNITEPEQTMARLKVNSSKDVWTSGIDVKIEFYLKDKGNYHALYRYDTVISKAMTISEYGKEFVELALQMSSQRLQQTDNSVANILNKRKFSFTEINEHNKNEFDIPALTDSILKTGVYMSFDEFKNNAPSQTHFEVKKDKLTDILYITQPNGKEWIARDVWGYSDGKNAFVKTSDNFFLLQRVQNAFYIFGAKKLQRTETRSGGTGGYYAGSTAVIVPYNYTSVKTFIQLEPFQLDWSSGKLY